MHGNKIISKLDANGRTRPSVVAGRRRLADRSDGLQPSLAAKRTGASDPLQPVASRVADVRGLLLIGQRRLGDAGIILKAVTGRWAYHGSTPISRRGDSVMDRRVPIDGMAAVIDVVSRNVRPILSAAPAKQPAMRRW
jgi:hypothetical protein